MATEEFVAILNLVASLFTIVQFLASCVPVITTEYDVSGNDGENVIKDDVNGVPENPPAPTAPDLIPVTYEAVAANEDVKAGFVLVNIDPVTYEAVVAFCAQLAVPIKFPVKDPVNEPVLLKN